jgi:hypothetical protein
MKNPPERVKSFQAGIASAAGSGFTPPDHPMKKLLPLLALLLAPAPLLAAQFEGTVRFKLTIERGKTEEMAYHLKSGKIRIDVGGQKEVGGIIMDVAKKQTIAIMDEQRMYLVMEMPNVAAQAAATGPGEATLEKTGETAKIAGYTAEKYVSKFEGRKAELWLAEGLGAFMSPASVGPMGGGGPGAGAPQAWERALAGKELFPLRVVGFDQRGREELRMEATAVDKKSLPDSLFAPPAGYQQFDMGGMMRGALPPGAIPGNR